MSTLYLVATPIGNLEDISPRAVRILTEVGLIAAEDTRHTRKLLDHYQIKTRLVSHHEYSQSSSQERILRHLESGDAALVSDAGTPLLNDPGYELVHAVLQAGHKVSPIPGPSAPLAALTASGLPTDSFLFLGYLPRKQSERRQKLAEIADLPYTIIFLETPHRLLKALEDCERILGDRPAVVAREITKLHEEFHRSTIRSLLEEFTARTPRGEITLVIAGKPDERVEWDTDRVRTALVDALKQDLPPSEIAALVAAQSGWQRREVYRLLNSLRNH